MKSRLLILTILLLSGIFAAETIPINCATPGQVLSITKIVDDIDRRTDSIESSMLTKMFFQQELSKIDNTTAKVNDIALMRSDFESIKQELNWKVMTLKGELFFLVCMSLFALFVFQKFWEVGQRYIDEVILRANTDKEKALIEENNKLKTRIIELKKSKIKGGKE